MLPLHAEITSLGACPVDLILYLHVFTVLNNSLVVITTKPISRKSHG